MVMYLLNLLRGKSVYGKSGFTDTIPQNLFIIAGECVALRYCTTYFHKGIECGSVYANFMQPLCNKQQFPDPAFIHYPRIVH